MGGTILLADDSITIQKVVELTFAGTDAEVVAVGSGRELLDRLGEVNPDVVLCDVVMPDMNGYDVCQAIKCDPATLHVPVVLLTGTFEPFDRERAVAVGCDSIVTKPFEARELVGLVEDLLRKSAASRSGEAAPEGQPFAEAAAEGLDFTTTGFDEMVPAPEEPLAPPDEGIDLTGSFRAEQAEEAPFAPVQDADTQPVVQLGEGAEARAGVSGAEAVVDDGATAPGGEPVEAEVAASVAAVRAETWGESVAEEAAATTVAESAEIHEAPVAAPGEAAVSARLTDEDVERIARRVVELNVDALERIAWEIVPDMAEMLVRKRIRELETAVEEEN
jgi:CheY-like chemotaxis protein